MKRSAKERDCGDIIDRWSIAKLKAERIGTDENKKELEAFDVEVAELKNKHKNMEWQKILDLILSINDNIWQLESGLKSGKEELKNPCYIFDKDNKEALSNIGAATILIRNFNNLRVQFKNLINAMVNEGFQDAKVNHLSERKV